MRCSRRPRRSKSRIRSARCSASPTVCAPRLPSFDPVRSDRTFSLLLTDVGMIRFLPPLIAHVAAIAPRVNIRAMPLDSRQFELKLEAGEADLALGAFPKAPRHLRRQRLYFDGYVTVVRKGHPKIPAVRSRAGFLAQRHILVTASETGHAAHGTAQRVLAVADSSGEYHAARAKLHRRRHRRGGNRRAHHACRPIWPSGLQGRLAWPAFETPIALPRIEITQYWHERYHRDRRASLVQVGHTLNCLAQRPACAEADQRIELSRLARPTYIFSTPHHSAMNSAVALVDFRSDSRSTYSLKPCIAAPFAPKQRLGML